MVGMEYDLNCEKPWSKSPILCAMNAFNCWPAPKVGEIEVVTGCNSAEFCDGKHSLFI